MLSVNEAHCESGGADDCPFVNQYLASYFILSALLSTIELTHGYTNNIIAGWCVRPVRHNWFNVDEVGGMCNVLREVTHLLLKQSRRQFRPALDIGACV